MVVVKTRGGILGLNRIDEALAELLLDAREKDLEHHGIPIHIGGIDVRVIAAFQESGALVALFHRECL
jgi:hypothetical protein